MPAFEPFLGIRYDSSRTDPVLVTAPPYDVISPSDRQHLVRRDPHNVVRVDMPEADPLAPDADPYRVAAASLAGWLGDGTLVIDDRPSFTIHQMISIDEDGIERRTTGVIGELRLSRPDEGEILPHEFTTPKARSDRLDLLRSTRANLSSVWGLSPAPGLSSLLDCDEPPLLDFTAEGVRNKVWRIDDPARIAEISHAIAGHPVVIADGHHRFETSLAYRDERRRSDGDGGAADAVMCFVVELSAEQLAVDPIHRLVSGLAADVDMLALLGRSFEIEETTPHGSGTIRRLVHEKALGLVTTGGEYLLRPRPELLDVTRDLDSSRLDHALESFPIHRLTYQHGVDNIRRSVTSGDADFGVLLRPVSVDQIVAIAHGGERMPPKSTFFFPKPRTGIVFRSLH